MGGIRSYDEVKEEYTASIDSLVSHWRTDVSSLAYGYVVWLGSQRALGEHQYTPDIMDIGFDMMESRKDLLDYFDRHYWMLQQREIPELLRNLPSPDSLVGNMARPEQGSLSHFIYLVKMELLKIGDQPDSENARAITDNIEGFLQSFRKNSQMIKEYLSLFDQRGFTPYPNVKPEGDGRIYRLYGYNNKISVHIAYRTWDVNILQSEDDQFTFYGDNTKGTELMMHKGDVLIFKGNNNEFVVGSEAREFGAKIVIVGQENKVYARGHFSNSPDSVDIYLFDDRNSAIGFQASQVYNMGSNNTVRSKGLLYDWIH